MYKQLQPLKINVISDIHYFAKSLGTSGPEFEKANAKAANDLLHTEEILEALETQLERENEPEIVLVSGDMTYNGEPESHEGAVKLLTKLQKSGKRVYVITATHDFRDNNKTRRFTPEGAEEIDATKRSELFDLYRSFGPDEAIAVHKESMSYVVQLCDGYRLFALNDDSNGEGGSGFSDECFKWITAQVADAKKNGQFIIAMTHHPMISPSPLYSIIGEHDMMTDAKKRCNQLADMGVPFMLTGHTHMQDISYTYSQKGNIFYDITTACPIGYPGVFRTIEFDPANKKIDISTRDIEVLPGFEMNGDTLEKHLENKFFGMIKEIVNSAAYDTKKLARMVTAFSVKPSVIYRYGWILRPFAKVLTKLKIKHVARICKKETGLKKEDWAAIADESVVDFIMTLVMNLYGGDGQYSPNTAYYKIAVGVCNVFDSILSALKINLSKLLKTDAGISELIKPLLYNAGIPDKFASLKLYPLYSSDNPAPERQEAAPFSDTVKKSKKGKGIISLTVIAVLVFLPLILLWLLFGFIANRIKFSKELKSDAQ
ncbi:MAG: metallophosphoesterase family protein [Acutalibacteraceae bacterium]